MESIKSGYTRVSDVLTPFTGIEFVDPEKLQMAAEKGTRVHSYIEETLKKEWIPSVIDPVCAPYLESFQSFWDGSSHLFKDCQMMLETRLYCDTLKITGKIDAIFTKPGRTYLVDWKSSSRFHSHWYLQGSAYQYLARVNGLDNPDEVLFVHLKKGMKPTTYKDSDPRKSLALFIKCLEIYNHFDMANTRKPNAVTIREH